MATFKIPTGKNYYRAGRYDYHCIDNTEGNGTGKGTLIYGIKTKKLAEEIENSLNNVQAQATSEILAAIVCGESENSETLYLYGTNHGELYRQGDQDGFHSRKDLDEKYREFFDSFGIEPPENPGDSYYYELKTLLDRTKRFFKLAGEFYSVEFPPHTDNDENPWINFTDLDHATAALKYFNRMKAEYTVNKLQ